MRAIKKTQQPNTAPSPLASGGSGKGGRRELSQYAAILVFCGLAALLCVSVRYGIQNDDETTCLAGAHRILFGELPVLDNWTVIQMHAFLEYLPFRLLYAILGGTEGIVLAIRYVYVAIKMLFFGWICIVFRQYRYWTILFAVIFTAFHPMDFLSLTYYNIGILCAFAVGVLLFVLPGRSVGKLIFCGVLFAFCVLAEPATIVVYAAFTVCVPVYYLLKKKKKKEISLGLLVPDLRTWGFMTVGAALIACVLLSVLLSAADLPTILKNAPGVLRFLQFHPQTNQWEKFGTYIYKIGVAPHAAAAVVLLLTLIARRKNALRKFRPLLFSAVCIVFIWMTAAMFLKRGVILSAVYLPDFKPVPLCLLGLASYLLCEEKPKALFPFFVYGVMISVCIDLLSRISVGTGCIISVPCAVLFLRQAILETAAEIRAQKAQAAAAEPDEKKKTEKKRSENKKTEKKTAGRRFVPSMLTLLPVTALLFTLLVSETAYCFYARCMPSPEVMVEEPMSESIEVGPLKGLHTVPFMKEKYDAVIADMDRLKADPPESLLVMHFCEWCNLYLDLPYATFSPDGFDTKESLDCLLYYWSLHPDKKPTCIYIPYYGCDNYRWDEAAAEEKLRFVQSVCDCRVETVGAGFLVTDIRWK